MSRSSPFQCNVHQRTVINPRTNLLGALPRVSGFPQFLTSAKRGLRDAHLLLVHLSIHRVSHPRLWNLAQKLVRVPLVHPPHVPLRMRATHMVIDVPKHPIRVSIVTDHHTTINTRALTYNDIGAGHRRCGKNKLEKLAKLKNAGILSEEEFQEQKTKLLNK